MLMLKNKVCIDEITHFTKLKLVKPAHALQEKKCSDISDSIRSYIQREKLITLFTFKFQKDYLAVGPLLMLIYFVPQM